MCFSMSVPKMELPPAPPPPAPVPQPTTSKIKSSVATRIKPSVRGYSQLAIPTAAPTVGGLPSQAGTAQPAPRVG
jgi:hypothetical protein